MARFAGKVALITGAGSGIGLASARRLAAEGATMIVFLASGDASFMTGLAIPVDGGRGVR